jgi:hypothetical protein
MEQEMRPQQQDQFHPTITPSIGPSLAAASVRAMTFRCPPCIFAVWLVGRHLGVCRPVLHPPSGRWPRPVHKESSADEAGETRDDYPGFERD